MSLYFSVPKPDGVESALKERKQILLKFLYFLPSSQSLLFFKCHCLCLRGKSSAVSNLRVSLSLFLFSPNILLHCFPKAAVMNCYKLDGLKQQIPFPSFWKSEVPDQVDGRADCLSRVWGRISSCLSRIYCSSAVSTFSVWCAPLQCTSSSYSTWFSISQISFFLLLRASVIGCKPTVNLKWSHLYTLNLITPAKVLF